MTPAQYIKQGSVNTLVLAYFFARAQTDNFSMTEDQVIVAFAGRIGANRVQMSLDTMKGSRYLEDVNPHGNDYVYALTAEGYSKAEKMYLDNENGLVRKIVELGLDEYFDRRGEQASKALGSDIPASDRYVTVSDNMAGYGEIVSSIEGADQAVRGANDLDSEERSWIRVHLEFGIQLLKKGGKVLQSAIKSLLVEPLEAALKDSSQENLQKAVQAALKALRTYLGIF